MALFFINRDRASKQTDEVIGGPVSFRKVDGVIELQASDYSGTSSLGRFSSAAEAWAALDQFELADDVELAA
jgi:hypothetical protein